MIHHKFMAFKKRNPIIQKQTKTRSINGITGLCLTTYFGSRCCLFPLLYQLHLNPHIYFMFQVSIILWPLSSHVGVAHNYRMRLFTVNSSCYTFQSSSVSSEKITITQEQHDPLSSVLHPPPASPPRIPNTVSLRSCLPRSFQGRFTYGCFTICLFHPPTHL